MCADSGIAEVVTDDLQMLLDLPCSEREYLCVCGNVVVHAVKSYELVQGKRNGKYAGFTCFLFNDGEPIAFTVFYNVGEPQPDYIRNTQA